MGLRLSFLSLTLLLAHIIFAQEITVYWPEVNNVDEQLKNQVETILSRKDSIYPHPLKIAQALQLLKAQGYWLAQIDTSLFALNFQYHIKLNKQIQVAKFDLVYKDTLTIKPQPYQYSHQFLKAEEITELTDYYLSFYENNGFPFASVSFTDYSVSHDSLRGKLLVSTGAAISFDSVALKGFDRFSKNVLKYDLGFYKGRPYSEKYLYQLQENVQQIEYLSFTRAPAVGFFKNKTTLFLYLQEEKGNQIDGVVGLNTETDGETTLNGDFQLRLLNTFKRGEEINLRWRRPDASVQQLQLGFSWPYLWSTPFWLQSDLEIFRQDSSFVNTNLNGLLKYLIASRSFIGGGFSYRSSNVLASEEGTAFSNLNAFESYKYLLGTELNRTNRMLVPTKGYQFKVYGITGNRVSNNISQEQYGWRLSGDYFLNFYKRMVLRMGMNSESIFGAKLFENELFRLGGLQTLRGFNEQSIFASGYGVGTLEYRYMIGTYDYLTVFADGAFVEKRTGNEIEQNFLVGLGSGINFRTNGGIFSLFIAVGKSDNTQFDLRTTKIHFGYTNRF